MKKYLLLLFVGLSFVACEQASNTVVGMPNVELDCREAGCNTTLNGDTAFVIVTKSGCANAGFDPVATGSTAVTCTANGCSGTVSSWKDANGNDVTEIITGIQDICSYIDGNGNTNEDAGEMKSNVSLSIDSATTQTITTWEVGT